MKLFAGQLAQARIQAVTELDAAVRTVPVDPEQMTRVVRNLVLNAIDAMPEGGTLTVRTAAMPGGVRLEISDTGQGLTPEECERLFTPYYTTKNARHGAGAGDRAIRGQRSRRADFGGERKGQGSTFRIELSTNSV